MPQPRKKFAARRNWSASSAKLNLCSCRPLSSTHHNANASGRSRAQRSTTSAAKLKYCGGTTTLHSSTAPLDPQLAVERAVLDRFGYVLRLDALRTVEIGNRARDLEDAVVGAGAQVQFGHCHFQELLALVVEFAV